MHWRNSTLAVGLFTCVLQTQMAAGATVVYDEAISGDLGAMRQSSAPFQLGLGQNEILGRTGVAFGTVGSNRGVVLGSNDQEDYFEFSLPDDGKIDSIVVSFNREGTVGPFLQLDLVSEILVWNEQRSSAQYLSVECSASSSPSPAGCTPDSGPLQFDDGSIAMLNALSSALPAPPLAALSGVWALPDLANQNVDAWSSGAAYKWTINVVPTAPVPEPSPGALLLVGIGVALSLHAFRVSRLGASRRTT